MRCKLPRAEAPKGKLFMKQDVAELREVGLDTAPAGRALTTIPRKRSSSGSAALVLADAALILASFAIAYVLRYNVSWPAPINRIVREVLTVNYIPYTQFILYALLIYALAWGAIILLLCAARSLLVSLRRWRWVRGLGRERVLVVGGTGLGRQVMESMVAQPFLGYALVGYLEDGDPPPGERPDGHFRHLGPLESLVSFIRSGAIDQVIIALPFWEHRRLPELVEVCREARVDFRVVPDLYELSFDRVDVGNLGSIPLIGLKELSLKGGNLILKRAMDLALTLIAAPIVLPLAGLIILAIKRDSPGPAIFRQERIGKEGQPFLTYKFRTMIADAEARKADLAALNEA